MITPPLACVASGEKMPDWEWVRSERRAKNPEIRKEEDELRLDFWIQITWTGWDERKWSSSVLLARRLAAFHWKTLRESGDGRGGTRRRRTARSKGWWSRGRGRRYRIDQRGIRSLKTRMGWECSISGWRARLCSGGIRVGGVLEESHSVSSGDTAGGAAPRVRAVKSSEFGEGDLWAL